MTRLLTNPGDASTEIDIRRYVAQQGRQRDLVEDHSAKRRFDNFIKSTRPFVDPLGPAEITPAREKDLRSGKLKYINGSLDKGGINFRLIMQGQKKADALQLRVRSSGQGGYSISFKKPQGEKKATEVYTLHPNKDRKLIRYLDRKILEATSKSSSN